jgi:hypothetical protein
LRGGCHAGKLKDANLTGLGFVGYVGINALRDMLLEIRQMWLGKICK